MLGRGLAEALALGHWQFGRLAGRRQRIPFHVTLRAAALWRCGGATTKTLRGASSSVG